MKIINRAVEDKHIDKFFLLLILMGLSLYYIGIVNMYVWVLVLILRLLKCNRVEIGFFCILVGSSIFGRIFAIPELNILMTIILLSAGMLLLFKDIVRVVVSYKHSVFFMILILLFFLIEFYKGPLNDYAYEKIGKASIRLFLWTTTFLIFSETKKISCNRVGLAFLILAIFYLSQSSQMYGIRPSSLLDMDFFRNYTMAEGRDENGTHVANYHSLAYLSLAGTVFWTIQKDFFSKAIKSNTVLLIGMSFWIIAISGARQGIFVFGIVTILRYVVSRKRFFSVVNIFYTAILALFFLLIVSLIGSSYFETALDSEGDVSSRLHRDTTTPFLVMAINPLYGVGFGGYPIYGNKDYPHNFFIEMICETGFIGLSILCLIFIIFFITNMNKNYLKYLTNNNSYLFVLFVLFFSRAQVSGDLTTSVGFMAILLSFISVRTPKILCKNA